MSKHDAIDDVPTADDVRAALNSVLASDVLRNSPQLAAFLRFVVEAVLHGNGERIKGYTIAVEVFRRDADFDPQIDPIVRVEATRLRRALERYYGGVGADSPVRINLARGSYVPTFSYRPSSHPSPAARAYSEIGNGMPTLLVEPFDMLSTQGAQSMSPRALHEKLCDAFARFDTINIAVEAGNPGHEPVSDYRLNGTLESRDDGTTTVRFRLVDMANRTVVWSRAFERTATAGGRADAEDAIVTELAAVLVQPFGVIRAHERLRHLATGDGDPRYRCIVEASESFRSFDPGQHAHARACLERLTSANPGFSIGFAYLAAIYFREFQYGYSESQNDRAMLDCALEFARRAIELKPQSSLAYQMLFGVLFARREIAAAFAAGDKAIALNRYDMTVVSDYGGRLVMTGEIERGMNILMRAAEFGTVRPSWYHFYLFLGSYLRGDLINTIHHANQITNENYPLRPIAHALAAMRAGEPERAAQALDRLKVLRPAWAANPRRELEKFIPNAEITGRLTNDLTKAGLVST
ncbi:MAG: hypothetical protein WA792_17450 [Pseudolabrys sp.]